MGTPLTGKPVPVVLIDGHSYKLDETALSEILLDPRVKDRPVVVISVAGAFRKGKSFLLDFILRYLNAPNDPNWLGDEDSPLEGFSWRCGSERDTTGILMWSEPFIVKLAHEEVAVLLMDTQGTFDRQSTMENDATVFALSTMLSSVQIYNLSMNIQENDLQHLQLFTEYGRLALQSNTDLKPFQTLQFLVRDWQWPYEYAYGGEGGKKLLEKILQVSGNQNEELRQVRNHIKSCFERIDCYLMPHPGLDVIESKFDGRLKDIREAFQTNLTSYIKLLMNRKNLMVKKINGCIVTGKGLLEYFITYVNDFQGDKLQKPETLFQATAKANNMLAVDEAMDAYCKEMDLICAPDKPHLTTEDLEREHGRCAGKALTSFKQTPKMGDAKFHALYERKLNLKLEAIYKTYMTLNERKLNLKLEAIYKMYMTLNESNARYRPTLGDAWEIGRDIIKAISALGAAEPLGAEAAPAVVAATPAVVAATPAGVAGFLLPAFEYVLAIQTLATGAPPVAFGPADAKLARDIAFLGANSASLAVRRSSSVQAKKK